MNQPGATDGGVGESRIDVMRWMSRKNHNQILDRFRNMLSRPFEILEEPVDLSGLETLALDPKGTMRIDDVHAVDFSYRKDKAEVYVVTPALHAVTCGWHVWPTNMVQNEYMDPAALSPHNADQFGVMWRFVLTADGPRENRFGMAYIQAEDVRTLNVRNVQPGQDGVFDYQRHAGLRSIGTWIEFLMIGHQIASGTALKQMGADFIGFRGNDMQYRGSVVPSTTPLRNVRSSFCTYQTAATFGQADPFAAQEMRRAAEHINRGRVNVHRYWKRQNAA